MAFPQVLLALTQWCIWLPQTCLHLQKLCWQTLTLIFLHNACFHVHASMHCHVNFTPSSNKVPNKTASRSPAQCEKEHLLFVLRNKKRGKTKQNYKDYNFALKCRRGRSMLMGPRACSLSGRPSRSCCAVSCSSASRFASC